MRTARSSSRLPGGGGSASVHAGIHHLRCWPGDTPPPGVDLETPPQPDPPTSPMGVGLEPPWTEFLTHASENITLPQLRCGR